MGEHKHTRVNRESIKKNRLFGRYHISIKKKHKRKFRKLRKSSRVVTDTVHYFPLDLTTTSFSFFFTHVRYTL